MLDFESVTVETLSESGRSGLFKVDGDSECNK